MDTPRPTRRQTSGRFPIRPSTSSIDIAVASTQISPAQSTIPPMVPKHSGRLPPTPLSAIRPGLEPLANGNERNRSNSESQMSTSKRKKRMGIQMSRGGTGSNEMNLESLAMNSRPIEHTRGPSSGSASATGIGSRIVHHSSSSASPTQIEIPRSALLSRLSSLPESKRKSSFHDPYVELVQGISFSMEQVHSPVKQLVSVFKVSGAKSRSLERYCYSSLIAMETLSHKLLQTQTYDEEKDDDQTNFEGHRRSALSVQDTCRECIVAFENLIAVLLQEIRSIVERANPRYVRTLMLLLYGSSIELRNAYSRFGSHFGTSPQSLKASNRSNNRPNGLASPVPRPTTSLKIKIRDRRRNDSTASDLNKPLPPPKLHSPYSGSILYTNSNLSGSGGFAGMSQHPKFSHGYYTPSLTPSISLNSAGSSLGGLDGFDDYDEDQQFEFIFQKLSVACESTIQGLSRSSLLLSEANTRAFNNGASEIDLNEGKQVCIKCQYALDAANDLKRRLAALKIYESRSRNKPELWQVCTAFTRVMICSSVETAITD